MAIGNDSHAHNTYANAGSGWPITSISCSLVHSASVLVIARIYSDGGNPTGVTCGGIVMTEDMALRTTFGRVYVLYRTSSGTETVTTTIPNSNVVGLLVDAHTGTVTSAPFLECQTINNTGIPVTVPTGTTGRRIIHYITLNGYGCGFTKGASQTEIDAATSNDSYSGGGGEGGGG